VPVEGAGHLDWLSSNVPKTQFAGLQARITHAVLETEDVVSARQIPNGDTESGCEMNGRRSAG